jgi:GTP1/Obg family GTP-binding protein
MRSELPDNLFESTIQQWRSYQWAPRLNRHLEMVFTLPAHTARFTSISYSYIQTIKIGQQQENDVEKQSNQGRMAEIMQQMYEMIRQINKFAEF